MKTAWRGLWFAVAAGMVSMASGQTTRYVWPDSPASAPPYEDWNSAAHTIQEAVDACASNDVVVVTNGTYATGMRSTPGYSAYCRVVATNGVRVVSVNGPAATIIAGDGAGGSDSLRCAYLGQGATLSGFTLSNGYLRASGSTTFDQSGGGALIRESGTLTNCVVVDCVGAYYGGGAACLSGGTVVDCTLVGNRAAGHSGGGVFMYYGGEVRGSYVAGNSAYYNGGGVGVLYTGAVIRCEIAENSADGGDGGGVHLSDGGAAGHCVVRDNWAGGPTEFDGGGGVSCYFGGSATNCAIYGNVAVSQGGGAKGTFGGRFVGCSIFDNEAGEGGGVFCNYYVTNLNNVVYHNRSLKGPNFATNGSGNLFARTCTTPLPVDGTGNFTNAPLLAGVRNEHLLAGSPCADAGDDAYAAGIAEDLDGDARIAGAAVDVGCDEWRADGATGTLAVAIGAAYTQTVVDVPLAFYADVEGFAAGLEWRIQTDAGERIAPNSFSETQAWSVPGSYAVVLAASNADDAVAATATVQVVAGYTNYASKTGSAAPPYDSWATAAASVYDAVQALPPGGTTLIGDGVFDETREIAVDKPALVCSLNGPAATAVRGGAAHRVFRLTDDGAELRGLSIEDGDSSSLPGGGVYVASAGRLANCRVFGCQADAKGGGVYLGPGAGLLDCTIVSNRADSSNNGGGAYFESGATATNCEFTGNRAGNYGGGAYFNRGSQAADSLFASNHAVSGGGGAYLYYGGETRNVQFLTNTSYQGGGAYLYNGGLLLNPHVAGNAAEHSGGGLYLYGLSARGTATHATVQGNLAGIRGGGVYASYGGRVQNSIVYYNEAPLGPNFFTDSAGPQYVACCMTPMPSSGAIAVMTNEPLFPGTRNPHLLAASPCREAASNALAAGIAVDVDAEPRTNGVAVDMGCDEYWPGGMTGTLSVAILASYTTAVVETVLPFTADVQGKATSLTWRVAAPGATNLYVDAIAVGASWSAAGTYAVVLEACNESGCAAATVDVEIAESFTNYVDAANPSPEAPYDTWAKAATGIAEAIAAAPAGGTVLITNGLYQPPAEIAVAKPVRVASVNGPDSVQVDGQGARRVFDVTAAGTTLEGLGIVNGNTGDFGGGIQCVAGTVVTNCRIASCQAGSGGGVHFNGGGLLVDSRLEFNTAIAAGGAVYCSIGGEARNCAFFSNATTSTSSGGGGAAYVHTFGVLSGCAFTNNRTAYRGGAIYAYSGGVVTNCLIATNAATGFGSSVAGGGVFLQYGGLLVQCVVSNNSSSQHGGGIYMHYGGLVLDSEVAANRAQGCGGGAYCDSSGTLRGCRLADNLANWNDGGGAYFNRGGVAETCQFVRNQSVFGSGGGVAADRAGLVATNCQFDGNYAANGGGGVNVSGYGRVVDSALRNNRSVWNGGGVYLNGGGSILRCALTNNSSGQGGGIAVVNAGFVSNCVVLGNAATSGGGIHCLMGGRVRNSYVAGNVATNEGGGIYMITWGEDGEVAHCTVVGNRCYGEGGGLWSDTAAAIGNSILYDNRAVFGPNWYCGGVPSTFEYCCTTPAPGGPGHVTDPPRLAGVRNPHLLPDSPCVDAGAAAWAVGLDIDRENRVEGAGPDVGCDELHATNLFGALSAAIVASATNAAVRTPVSFASAVQGPVAELVWSVQTEAGDRSVTNDPAIEHVWTNVGVYAVTLAAANGAETAAATVAVTVVESLTNYVSPAGAHVYPFASWANASTTIADAVGAAVAGGVVLVSNGVYREAGVVYVDKPLAVRGLGGWDQTIMDGQGANRCFFATDPAAWIEGFTFSNAVAGADLFGGGGAVVLAEGGTVSHCRFVDCRAEQYGGGAVCYRGGAVLNCWFAGNAAMFGGGALCYYGGTVANSTFVGNRAYAQGGGVYCEGGGAVRNSILWYNHAPMGPDWFGYQGGYSFDYVCAGAAPPGTGNFATEPGLAGLFNPHLLAGAPCVDAGSDPLAADIAVDWDGENRVLGARVDVGCDEFEPAGLTGGLAVAVSGASFRAAPDLALEFWALVDGKPAQTEWAVDTGSGIARFPNQVRLSQSWTAPGTYQIVLSASNGAAYAAATATVAVVAAGTLYVDPAGNHVPPFASWADAATNLAAALAAAADGDQILVNDGVYREGAETIVDKAVRIVGANGPEAAIFDGNNAHRVFRLEHPQAVLTNLGIRCGNAQNSVGGGAGGVILAGGGTLANCHVYSNVSPGYAGGVLLYGGGAVAGCVVRHNSAEDGGGVQFFNGGTVAASAIVSNRANNRGAGALLYFGGLLTNCVVERNLSNMEGGGVSFCEGGVCANSLIVTNEANEGGGAYFYDGGTLLNCVVASNFGWSVGGGLRAYKNGLARNCAIFANSADVQWGFGHGGGANLRLGGQLENCTVVENAASTCGGVQCSEGGTVLNSIVWSNLNGNVDGADEAVFAYTCIDPAPEGTVVFAYDPRFVDWVGRDYRLASNSPCVEQGLNAGWMAGAADLVGAARIQNAYVDLGAYESAWSDVDVDGDGLSVGQERTDFGTSDFLPDTDGDGQDDFEEGLITGTEPTNPASFFAGYSWSQAGQVLVRWPSLTDRVYRVETLVDLRTNEWQPVPGWSNVAGVSGFMVYTSGYADAMRHFRPVVARTNW